MGQVKNYLLSSSYTRQSETRNLVNHLWPERQPIMALPGPKPDKPPEPGQGKWPKRPKHTTCDNATYEGTIITFYAEDTHFSKMTTPSWRDLERKQYCPACYYKRVKRLSLQILTELETTTSPLWQIELPNKATYKRTTDKWRKRQERGTNVIYCTLPQKDGRFIVIHNQESDGGQLITNDKTVVFNLIHKYAQTPENRRVSCTKGFGKNYQGVRGDGRRKYAKKQGQDVGQCFQAWTSNTLLDCAQALNYEPHGKNSFSVKQSAIDVYLQLTAANITLREKGSNKHALDAFLQFVAPSEETQPPEKKPNVTHNSHKQSNSLYTLSVTSPKNNQPKGKCGKKTGVVKPPLLEMSPPKPLSQALFGGVQNA